MLGCRNMMPDLSNLSYFPEDKKEISIYLFWEKDIIALAKKSIQIMRYTGYFFLFLEGLLMSIHIFFNFFFEK